MKALTTGPDNGHPEPETVYQQLAFWLYHYREMKDLDRNVPDRQDLDAELRTRLKVHYEQKKRGFEPPSPMEFFSP